MSLSVSLVFNLAIWLASVEHGLSIFYLIVLLWYCSGTFFFISGADGIQIKNSKSCFFNLSLFKSRIWLFIIRLDTHWMTCSWERGWDWTYGLQVAPTINHQLEPPPMRSDHETENESSRSRTFSVPVVQITRACYKIWHHVTAQVVGWPHHNTNHCLVKWETRPCCEC